MQSLNKINVIGLKSYNIRQSYLKLRRKIEICLEQAKLLSQYLNSYFYHFILHEINSPTTQKFFLKLN